LKKELGASNKSLQLSPGKLPASGHAVLKSM